MRSRRWRCHARSSPGHPATAAHSFRRAVSHYTVSAIGPALVQTILVQSPKSTVACEPLDEVSFDKLDAGTLDLVIYGRAAPERYSGQHLFTDRFVCLEAADHPLARRASVSLSQYLRRPHLSIDIGQPGVDRSFEARDTAPSRCRNALPRVGVEHFAQHRADTDRSGPTCPPIC